MRIPEGVRELIARKREADDLEKRAERARRRAERREQKRIRDLKRPLARRALEWARALARTVDLPARGLEIFQGGKGRIKITATVLPDGALVMVHVAALFGGSRLEALHVRELVKAPLEDLEQVVGAIEGGAVWAHIKGRDR